MERKNLIAINLILTTAALVLLIFNFQRDDFWAQRAQINISQNRPIKISSGAVDYFEIKKSVDKIVFYENSDSIVYEADLSGRNKKELARIKGASKIIFNPGKKEIIATVFGIKTYFDLENNKKVQLHENIKNAAFSPDGERVAYHFYDSRAKEGSISISNQDRTVFNQIFRTEIENIEISWPQIEIIVFHPAEKDGGPVFSLDVNTGEVQKVVLEPVADFLGEFEIKPRTAKLSPLQDYLIFINSKDGGLYSLEI